MTPEERQEFRNGKGRKGEAGEELRGKFNNINDNKRQAM